MCAIIWLYNYLCIEHASLVISRKSRYSLFVVLICVIKFHYFCYKIKPKEFMLVNC